VLAITISETIEVDGSGCAQCSQKVSYTNASKKPYAFSGISVTFFHKDCDDFVFTDSTGEIHVDKLDVQDEPYQKRLIYSLSGSLSPQNTASYTLEYNWTNFSDDAGFKKIATKFDSLTNYNLTIIVDDDTFTDRLISVKDRDQVLTEGAEGDYHVTMEGHLFLSRQHLSRNSNMDIHVIAKIRKINLNVVRDMARDYKDCLAQKHVVVCVIHLLRDSLPFFDHLLSMSIEKNDLFIVGIPYSSKIEVVEHLMDDGFYVRHIDRARYIDDFLGVIKAVLLEACKHCERTKKSLLIIEDGGYAVPLLHEDGEFTKHKDVCVGAVEQTANGIWADQLIAENNGLLFPVMNVAESRIKRELESPLVGTAIIQNINQLLEGYGIDIRNQKVGQIGCGVIGRRLALEMQSDGVDVTIYDLDEEINKEARKDDFKVAQSLEELLPGKTLIIGCTGKEVVGLSELRNVDRNIYFVNATSKLRELKYKEFLDIAEKLKIKAGIGTEYKLKGGREIIILLLADGFPVNFFGGSQSIPDKKIQFIPALLLGAAGHLVSTGIREPLIHEIPSALEDRIENLMALYDKTT
jgi:S-adenosylhomocysteine hydrolase